VISGLSGIADLDAGTEMDNHLIISHCGFEDSVMNHLILTRDLNEWVKAGTDPKDISSQMEKRELSRRHFTVQAIT